jgi:carboxyl-terminal processing protease
MRRLTPLLAAVLLACALPASAAPANTPPALPQAQLEKLLSAYALIKQQYVGQVDDDRLFDGALSGMLAALDAHSQYLSKEDMQQIDREASGDYVGIGIGIEIDHERMRVDTVAPGSPAERAGVQAGDVVVAADGVPLTGLSNAEVARRMHGASGSSVTLALVRAGSGAARNVTIARAALHETTVSARSAAPGLAWIRIEEFGGTTGAELVAALKSLDAAGAPRGLILDLRNNPGGAVQSAVAVAGAFLPNQSIVFTARGRASGEQRIVTVDPRFYRGPGEADVLAGLPGWARSVPLTVLVNGSSASAAEMLAAALQDHGRARLVGTPTFGKGSIQAVIPLDGDSGVKFTIARYFSPDGHEIQAPGVTPDVAAAPAGAGNRAAADLLPREADLANHLPPQDGTNGPARSAAENTRGFGGSGDAALKAAVTLLDDDQDRSRRHVPTVVARLREWTSGLGAGGARGVLAP